jgi:hypothetical protein
VYPKYKLKAAVGWQSVLTERVIAHVRPRLNSATSATMSSGPTSTTVPEFAQSWDIGLKSLSKGTGELSDVISVAQVRDAGMWLSCNRAELALRHGRLLANTFIHATLTFPEIGQVLVLHIIL